MPKVAKELGALAVSRLVAPGMHPVGKVAGLYLQVSDKQSRSWILRVKVGDRRREIGLGAFPAVSLADARAKAQAEREKIRAGFDPILERRAADSKLRAAQASEITFAEAAKQLIASKTHGWKNVKHAEQWKTTLAEYAEPVLGKMFVRHIGFEHVLKVLEPIWTSKTETASRVRGRIEAVLSWSRVKGYRSGDNPAAWRGNLDHLLAKPGDIKRVKHHPALAIEEMGDFMPTLRALTTNAARCLEFAILTAGRSNEVRGARWTEIDLNKGIWAVPGDRMKLGKEHRVPLSTAAVALLKAMPQVDDVDLVFPSPRGKVLSDMTLLEILRRLNLPATPHGFRSTFRDWASENTNHARELAEVALAHVKGDSSEEAYWRGDVLERRRQLMEDWAQFISRPFKSGNVLPMQRQA